MTIMVPICRGSFCIHIYTFVRKAPLMLYNAGAARTVSGLITGADVSIRFRAAARGDGRLVLGERPR